jgi:hypothetical protein
MNSTLLVISFGGFALLTWFSTPATALLVAGFLAIDAIFFHVLQGPTAAGMAIITQLSEYRKFLSEVDADLISRIHSCESVPAELTQKHAYAIAFRLDLGWGEQFVDAVTSLVERVEVFGKVLQPQDS